MFGFPTIWSENSADSLLDISIKYCIRNPYTFCNVSSSSPQYRLRDGISLPEEICERMLSLCKTELNDESYIKFLHIFQDPTTTRISRVNLSKSLIDDEILDFLAQHSIVELDLSSCENLTEKCIVSINKLKNSLQSLTFGESVHIFGSNEVDFIASREEFEDLRKDTLCLDTSNIIFFLNTNFLDAPGLRKLVLCGLSKTIDPNYYCPLLANMRYLTHLDFSKCEGLGELQCIAHLKHLLSLVLYNVPHLEKCVAAICKIKSLRHLDLSHSEEFSMFFKSPNRVLKCLVDSLENLVSLDISGTNLAGLRTQEREESPSDRRKSLEVKDETVLTDIPGLKSRVKRPLEFLGLLQTAHEACYRHHIPSKKITGDANEEQILTSAQVYCGRKEMIQKVLNDLFHIFKFSTCRNIRLALDVVMEAMRQHVKDKSIQISGSASLFYIVKGEEKNRFNIKIRKRIITALLNAMFAHKNDVTMVRNGCLTLIHFNIPEDVVFEYERLVKILLEIISHDDQDEFVQRIGVYLLNSLACQVNGVQKQLLGDLGVISIMLQIVEDKVNHHLCNEVMETAWSTMWNVTDETPINCGRFLEFNGMNLFLKCLKIFPEKPELLRNMMGLLGNVAEVKELRHCLMKDEYLSVFSELLESKSDGIEVSYNAAGILAHIASDGPELWLEHNISSVKRNDVLQRMVAAIESWALTTKRNINYRSFEPILRLLYIEHTPEAQYWAVWALANLTQVYPDKYCALLEKEGGISMLKQLIRNPGYPCIYELANKIIKQCQRHGGVQ